MSVRSNKKNNNNDNDVVVEEWLSKMTLEDQIGQMSQIDINMLIEKGTISNGDKPQLQLDQVTRFIGEQGIGSVLNLVDSLSNNGLLYWTALDYRRAMIQINQVAQQYHRPPVIWGLDSVHGANYIHGAIVTPQPLNIAATFNRTVAYEAGVLASRDTRAAGINWLFSPLLGIALEPLWSRVYETYGEDPVLVAEMAQQTVTGIQNYTSTTSSSSSSSPSTKPSRAAACAKHFVGYSMPRHGHDRSPSWIPTRHLYQYFVPPWKKVLSRSTGHDGNDNNDDEDDDITIPRTVMESYTETNGVPNVANQNALNYLLRQRLGFEGVLVTDYNEIYNLHGWHHVVANDSQAVHAALDQGSVDMSMIPWKADDFRAQVLEAVSQDNKKCGGGGGVSQDRIATSARRVLQLKHDLNMLKDETESFQMKETDPALHLIGTDEEEVLHMVHQSIVMTKNENQVLPLRTSPEEPLQVLVTGPTAASLSYQCGGWTGAWQGVPRGEQESSWFTYGSTVLQAFSRQPGWDVSYACGTSIVGGECNDDDVALNHGGNKNRRKTNVVDDVKHWVGLGGDEEGGLPTNSIDRAVVAATNMNVVVICVGEESYTEKPGDITSLELPPGQVALVKAIHESQAQATSPAKIVLVYFGGRPRLLNAMVDHAHAVLVAFLPGPSAGDALVDLMSGAVNPSGKLPMTYPKYNDASGTPYYHAVSEQCTANPSQSSSGKEQVPLPHYENKQCDVQWPFGHGLSYTTFAYSNLHVTGNVVDGLQVMVDVANTGNRAGSEVVLIFTFDEYRAVTPEYKRLRAFEKIHLETAESKTVHFAISSDELRFVGPLDDSHYILDPKLELIVGVTPHVDCRAHAESDLCAKPYDSHKKSREKASSSSSSSSSSLPYSPACEAACGLWTKSGCLQNAFHSMGEAKCLEMCGAVNQCTVHGGIERSSLTAGSTDGWGWNYVACLESVVSGMKDSSSVSLDKSDCWKMTALCRDVFRTDQMNEFGIGPSSHTPGRSSSFNPLSDSTTTNVAALCFGLVSSFIIVMLMRGSCSQQKSSRHRRQGSDEYSAIQFSGMRPGEQGNLRRRSFGQPR